MSLTVRIFPTPDPAGSTVLATLESLPPRLTDLLAMPADLGHGDYLSAWLVGAGKDETDVFLFRSIEDRRAFMALANLGASGLRFLQGFETNKVRTRAGEFMH